MKNRKIDTHLLDIDKICKSHLNKKKGKNSINLWSITHFLLFVVFGLYYKHKYLQLFIVSIIYELFEIYNLGINHESNMNMIMDILFNMSGYYIGSQLSTTRYNSVIIIIMWLISYILSNKDYNRIDKSFYGII